MAALLLILAVMAPMAWFVSEFQTRTWLRIALGIAALFGAFFGGAIWDVVNNFDSNSYFGSANEEFIGATLLALEQGRTDEVLGELRKFRQTYTPTYENRARYKELVEAYSSKLNTAKDDAISPSDDR